MNSEIIPIELKIPMKINTISKNMFYGRKYLNTYLLY